MWRLIEYLHRRTQVRRHGRAGGINSSEVTDGGGVLTCKTWWGRKALEAVAVMCGLLDESARLGPLSHLFHMLHYGWREHGEWSQVASGWKEDSWSGFVDGQKGDSEVRCGVLVVEKNAVAVVHGRLEDWVPQNIEIVSHACGWTWY